MKRAVCQPGRGTERSGHVSYNSKHLGLDVCMNPYVSDLLHFWGEGEDRRNRHRHWQQPLYAPTRNLDEFQMDSGAADFQICWTYTL